MVKYAVTLCMKCKKLLKTHGIKKPNQKKCLIFWGACEDCLNDIAEKALK